MRQMGGTMNFESKSQAGQDQWVWEMTEHKTDGFYVDLGCNVAQFHSNTYALEQQGWKGILVDIVGGCEERKGTFILSDAASPNERLRLYYKHLPTVGDYLSLDCDDSTLGAFNALPWDRTTFRLITVETDVYRKGPADRDKMRAMLKAMGYHLVCGDVFVEWPEGTFVPYEDWFSFPDLVNPQLIKRFQSDGVFWKDILKQ